MEYEVKVNLTLSEAAVKELKRVKEDNSLGEDTYVRVQILGGGCSGFRYGLNLVNKSETSDDDLIKEFGDIKLAVDRKSLLFLDGTTIDWVEDLDQRGFKFDNPNATKTCGCGHSFQA